MTVDDFLARLERVSGRAPLWAACCPAHEDRNASLSVREGDDGRTLVHCHTGCERADVVGAMGLSMSDLFVERAERRERVPAPPPQPFEPPREGMLDSWCRNLRQNVKLLERLWELKGWTETALDDLDVGWDGERLTLPVRDEAGGLCGLARYLPGGSPKMLTSKGSKRALWPSPGDYHPGEPILFVEGETDAIGAASLGIAVTALPGAASWDDSWAPRFAGRRVVVMFDCDSPGRKAATRVCGALASVAWVRSIDLNPERSDGYDLGDLMLAQREKGQLPALAKRLHALLED